MTAWGKSGIIGVSVGPGLMQLSRIPLAGQTDRRIHGPDDHGLLGWPVPPGDVVGMRLAPRLGRLRSRVAVGPTASISPHLLPALTRGRGDTGDGPAGHHVRRMTKLTARWRMPTKFTSMTSSREKPCLLVDPAQLKRRRCGHRRCPREPPRHAGRAGPTAGSWRPRPGGSRRSSTWISAPKSCLALPPRPHPCLAPPPPLTSTRMPS